jgi:hypothetical protein
MRQLAVETIAAGLLLQWHIENAGAENPKRELERGYIAIRRQAQQA